MDRNSSGAKADSVSRVALRKESVDRNATTLLVYLALIVALRKESVDRNLAENFSRPLRGSRSPQGERG